ncbi:hypothetical protein HCI13_02785 [Escherichia coli]|uniref:Secreted protein n=1 Tax=Escherichia coli TaxID=562 RepID=A0A376JU84_ECOLX|nr:hypothetical protein [Escherichia coli]EEZ6457328.1 hypothetical protein [Escherichia coli O16]HBN3807174.1 hypothetical protein [Escherichia coli O25b:H4-ST131]EET8788636.1 hypothetical protein [Escherichia coli]EET9027625.1 hypothetical protein [Escherichia coli]EEW1555438.1 hypothetical protein [Escherichia coli]
MKKLILAALLVPPFASSATTFTCKAIQEGQIDSGSQKSSVETRLDVRDKIMKVSMGGKTWRLGFIGEKSIAKMYATPDGGIAVTYIDNGSDPVFVMRPTNNDGETALYTLSLCSEI